MLYLYARSEAFRMHVISRPAGTCVNLSGTRAQITPQWHVDELHDDGLAEMREGTRIKLRVAAEPIPAQET